jgi:lipopolysaccharide/colanic/teichoic acid biosynthesis glycosyltransferase
MAARLFDFTASLIALIVCVPILAAAAIGIWLSSPGPVFYRARRVGRGAAHFVMYKFRTMHVSSGPVITAKQDARIFAFGSLLRRLKIDELPQLVNILRGDMSIVGPRPEDPMIVFEAYSKGDLETLSVLPGLLSPGSIYYYTHGEQLLGNGEDPTTTYLKTVLPIKLALDRVYVQRRGMLYNVRLITRTVWVIMLKICGTRHFSDPPEMAAARSMGFLL